MKEGTAMNKKRSRLAISSLALGILSYFVISAPLILNYFNYHYLPDSFEYTNFLFCSFLMGISAVIIAFVSLLRIRQSLATGKGMALTGMVLGVIGIILSSTMSIHWRIQMENLRRNFCANGYLEQIGLAFRMYSQEYMGFFPDKDNAAGFEILRSSGFLENTRMYTCSPKFPLASEGAKITEDNVSYLYAAGANESNDRNMGIACDKPGNHGNFGNILFIDGHAEGFSGKDWINSCNNPKLIELYRKEKQNNW